MLAGQFRNLVLREIAEVTHVGDLDPTSRTARPSLEAFMVSVSCDPEDWEMIAQCGGQHWTLQSEGALWLDAHAIDKDQEQLIAAWGIERGHATAATLWRAWSYDSEADAWGYGIFDIEEDARDEIDPDFELDHDGTGEVPSANGSLLEPIKGAVLTDQGMEALERWHDRTGAADGLLILWAREVLLPEMPDVVGIWWDDDHDPNGLSCPRGGVFPERLDRFEIANDHGALPPIRMHPAVDPEP